MVSGYPAFFGDGQDDHVSVMRRRLYRKLCLGMVLCALWGGMGISSAASGIEDPLGQVNMADDDGGLGLPPLLVVSSAGAQSPRSSGRRGGQRPPRTDQGRADQGQANQGRVEGFPQMVFIRMDALSGMLDEYRVRSEEVKRQTIPAGRELQDRMSRLLAEIDGLPDLRDTLGEEAYQTRRQALLEQKRKLEQELEALNSRVLDLGERILDPVRKRIQATLLEYARERQIEVVVDQRLAFELVGLIYAHPRRDITEGFARYYNARYPVRGVTRRSD